MESSTGRRRTTRPRCSSSSRPRPAIPATSSIRRSPLRGGFPMPEQDQYFLGYREAEQARLQRQAEELAHEARALFARFGLGAGARVVEIGCGPQGCLDILSELVGPSGHVVGVERNEDAVG